MSLKSWLQEIASVFQPTYNRIKAWDLTPQQQVLLDGIWVNLSPQLQKALWAFITLILAKFGQDAAKKILENILAGIKKEGWVIER